MSFHCEVFPSCLHSFTSLLGVLSTSSAYKVAVYRERVLLCSFLIPLPILKDILPSNTKPMRSLCVEHPHKHAPRDPSPACGSKANLTGSVNLPFPLPLTDLDYGDIKSRKGETATTHVPHSPFRPSQESGLSLSVCSGG